MAAQDPAGSFRDAAVARVLDPARERAEQRVQRFLDAAMELMTGASGKDFTVQEVVERSGQSLRSFYQYFDGKYELLLALFEEAIRTTAGQLRELTDGTDDPLEKLHLFTIEYFRACQPAPKAKPPRRVPAAAMADFAQRLLTEHPVQAARAFVPLVDLVDELLAAAADDGQVRAGLDRRRVAGVLLQATMFHAFSATIGGAPAAGDPAESLWDLFVHGISA